MQYSPKICCKTPPLLFTAAFQKESKSPETKKKIERYRQIRKDYGDNLFAVLMLVFVYAMLSKHDIMDYLHLLQKRPASGIGLVALLLLLAAGLHLVRWQIRELRQEKDKQE